jgi:hypothetical protein
MPNAGIPVPMRARRGGADRGGRQHPAQRQSQVPDDFIAGLFAYAVPGPHALRSRQLAGSPRTPGPCSRWQAGRAENPPRRVRCVRRPRAAAHRVRARDRQRRHAFPLDLGLAELAELGTTSASWCTRLHRGARPGGRLTASRAPSPPPALRESVITSMSSASTRRRAAPRSSSHRAGARRRPRLRCRLAGDDRARRDHRRAQTNPPPLPAAGSPRPCVPRWLVDNNFTFLGIRNYQLTAGRSSSPCSRAGWAFCVARHGVVQRGTSPRPHAGDAGAAARADAAHRHQAAARSRVHRRVHWTTSA